MLPQQTLTSEFHQQTGPYDSSSGTTFWDKSHSPAKEENTSPMRNSRQTIVAFHFPLYLKCASKSKHFGLILHVPSPQDCLLCSLLTLGNVARWGHLLRLNTASCFFGMEIRGVLSTSGSSSKTGWDGTPGIRTSSEGSVSDWLSADSTLDRLAETTLSGTLSKALSLISSIWWAVGGGVSLDGWKLPMEKNQS